MDQEQLNQTENNMPPKKRKSQTNAKKAIANMGANMAAMMSPASPVTDTQPVNAEGTEIGSVETTLSSVPDNPPVTNHVQDAKVQSAESAECNDIPETETPSEPVGGSKMAPPTPVEVNIDIEKTQGNAIYSSLLGLQNTLDNFELDVNKDSLRLVVHNAIKEAISEHLVEQDKSQLEKEEKLRSEGKPGTVLEAYQQATKINAEAIDKFNNNTHAIKRQYKVVADALCELLGRVNLSPYEKPKFKDDNGHVLLNSLYLYPWYYFKCFYCSKHVRGFFKLIAWSIWLICIGLLFFITRDNAVLQKQKNINRYVHAYFSDNDEVMMELDGIDLMFSDENLKPMPIKDYREYMKERKKEAKDKAKSGKQK